MKNVSRTLTIGGMAFLTGIAAGVTTGLLAAPHSGVRTRRKISRIAGRVGNHTYRKFDQAKHRLDTVLEDGKRLANWK